jgi:hypothetical protein
MKISYGAGLTAILAVALLVALAAGDWSSAEAGQVPPAAGLKALSPISHGNLTIFPVVAGGSHDTRMFITLDDGLRSGEVVITEAGQVQGLMRRRPGIVPPRTDSAQVNRLVLVNNSDHPLILLAGEIVTGGKQDRVVGKDRIIPANSDPVDLGVFCVEPGRWTGVSQSFSGLGKGVGGGIGTQMAQPSVRSKAMARKDQQQVWNSVNESVQVMAQAAPSAAPTSSYAKAAADEAVRKRVETVAAPVERSYESVIRKLRSQNAVGVVVAINGEVVWADVFASTALLEKYWSKLVRSYAAESLTSRAHGRQATVSSAQDFLDDMTGTKQVVETEPGLFRHTEIIGQGYHAFELASLLPKTGFEVHVSKMAE